MPDRIGLTRRGFLAATGAAVVAAGLVGCGSHGGGTTVTGPQTAFQLSGRGRSVSNAALSHNHSMVFVSEAAADAGRAHAGDNSKVVPTTISAKTWMAYFGAGATQVDLRKL
jgi:hypothetical protein